MVVAYIPSVGAVPHMTLRGLEYTVLSGREEGPLLTDRNQAVLF